MILRDDITQDGDPVLRQHAEPVPVPVSDDDKQLGELMMEYLVVSQQDDLAEKYDIRGGVGYAAPQIGQSKRLIAVLVPDLNDPDAPAVLKEIMVNPRILSHSVERICLPEGEGCLSVEQDVPGYVPRFARITVEYYTLDGEKHKRRFKGYPAIVIQHEVDHLNGTLYYDHIDKTHPWSLPDKQTFLLGDEF